MSREVVILNYSLLLSESFFFHTRPSDCLLEETFWGTNPIDWFSIAFQVTNLLLNRLPQFSSSGDIEVQERATCLLQLVQFIQKAIQNGDPLAQELEGLFAGEMNPVAPKAQKKVPVPDGWGSATQLRVGSLQLHSANRFFIRLRKDLEGRAFLGPLHSLGLLRPRNANTLVLFLVRINIFDNVFPDLFTPHGGYRNTYITVRVVRGG